MKVAILDSGCKYADKNINVTNEDEHKDRGHGNVVGSIIKDIAPNCYLVSIKVTEHGVCNNELLARGLVQCMIEEVDIINISLGLSGITDTVAKLIDFLVGEGVTIVCASGNNCVCYPAHYKNVISVGACDEFGEPTEYTLFGYYDVLERDRYEYQGRTYYGTSFACSRYTGWMAKTGGGGN